LQSIFKKSSSLILGLKDPKFITMPKMKTHSSAKKRFKVTGSGKLKRQHANSSHLMRKKTKKRKLKLRHATTVSKADEKRIKMLLCLR